MSESLATTVRAANDALIVVGDEDAVDDYFVEGYVAHITDVDRLTGRAAVRGFLRALRKAFADLEVDVDILVEGDGRVAWRRTVSGTHRESYMGFPATGGTLRWRDMIVSRFEDGLIAEEWAVSDMAEQLLRARKS